MTFYEVLIISILSLWLLLSLIFMVFHKSLQSARRKLDIFGLFPVWRMFGYADPPRLFGLKIRTSSSDWHSIDFNRPRWHIPFVFNKYFLPNIIFTRSVEHLVTQLISKDRDQIKELLTYQLLINQLALNHSRSGDTFQFRIEERNGISDKSIDRILYTSDWIHK